MASRRAFLHHGWRSALGLAALTGLRAPLAPAVATAAPVSNRFVLAQLQYRGGNWDPRPRATLPLLQEVRLRTSVETSDERKVLTLGDPALFMHPFLYMTGNAVLSRSATKSCAFCGAISCLVAYC